MPGQIIWAEYTDTTGEYGYTEEAVVVEVDQDGLLKIKFLKPVVEPHKRENVYLKLTL